MLNLTYIVGLELINFLTSFTFCKPSLLNYIEKHIKRSVNLAYHAPWATALLSS